MALSEFAVRQAKVADKTFTLNDFHGLSLSVAPNGSKAWHFRFYWAGGQQRISLGTYPAVGLREARDLRDQARALLAQGIDPRRHRKQQRQAVRVATANTFKSIYSLWFAHRQLELKAGRQSTLSQIERIFGNDVLPRLGAVSILEIERSDLLDVLGCIEARGALSIAEKVRTWLNQLFRFALVKVPGLTLNPASDLNVVALPKSPVVHNPFLRFAELPGLLRQLRSYRGSATTQLGIRLLLLTGVRTGELRLATPDQFDLARGLWIIPPEVVKQLQDGMRKKRTRAQDIPPYIVPLSIQAQEVVRYLLAGIKPAQRYLLAHRYDLTKRISENTLNTGLKRMGYHASLTGHGIRATLSTALNEIGYPSVWVEAQLSHCDPNKARAAYNHAQHVEPRRRMMQDWADRLDMLEQGQVDAASKHLIVRVDGMPVVAEHDVPKVSSAVPAAVPEIPVAPPRLSAVPNTMKPSPVENPSAVQRERMAMLAIYEAPHSLPVARFAKLAGKSKDQINREIKAGKLLTLSVGNRGQRLPDWQLDPLQSHLIRALLKAARDVDAWCLYRALTQASEALDGQSPIAAVTTENVADVVAVVRAELDRESAPECSDVNKATI